jgi:hypothetical protein
MDRQGIRFSHCHLKSRLSPENLMWKGDESTLMMTLAGSIDTQGEQAVSRQYDPLGVIASP